MTACYPRGPHATKQLLVYLHGHGNEPAGVHPALRGHHDDGWVRLCPQGAHRTDGGWSWFPTGPRGVPADALAEAVAAVTAVVDAAVADLGLTWDDVVLGGFSQGGAMALAVAAARPTVGGVLVQAAFVPEPDDGEVDLAAVRARAALVQHGAADEVVPAWFAADIAAQLTGVGQVTHQELDGGHVLDRPMLDAALAWLGLT